MREFTWWRRFHKANHRLPKQYLYKGASELLQRIEFGEFEYCHLAMEEKLENKIYVRKIEEFKAGKPWINDDNMQDQIRDVRKQHNKRRTLIMKNHMEKEDKILMELRDLLASEFNLRRDQVQDIMEEFDGTTRELYYKVKWTAEGKGYSQEQVDRIPRLINEQPRHILKPKERKHIDLWMEVVKEFDLYERLNWNI
jgi:hypothetical protein